ncbi:HD domain-containing protein [Bacillus ndiopicus]|uniref:HD domain-containing protein n=1 Tax=Bacillus ndiopicus TaxID=1347368 RepID=UPI0005A6B7C7|nr:HD domain-containing protein [Bacillus ndiopicus]
MKEVLLKKASYIRQAEMEELQKAMDFAEKAHAGQYRISGEPYIIHPFAVTEILLDYKADITTLIAALLHDVVEDTHHTSEEIEKLFGTKVANIVDGLTKVDKKDIAGQDEYKAVNLKKLLLATQVDVRVAIIKVVDRLHNMRTLQVKTAQKQVPYASETLKIFSPLCKKLKLFDIQHELEDLSFLYLKPSKYDRVIFTLKQYEQLLESLSQNIFQTLKTSLEPNINLTVNYEMEPMYSAYSNLKDSENLEAISKFILTTSNSLNCYKILGLIHQIYQPISHQFENNMAIDNDSLNKYLKTVITINHHQVAIFIETAENRLRRKKGVFYFLTNNATEQNAQHMMNTFIQTNHLLTQDVLEFYDLITSELLQDTITVFTPKLDPIHIPQGSTIIDFAFALDSTLAKCMFKAKINGMEKPLSTNVSNLDVVELLVADKENTDLDNWLNFANSSKAQLEINRELRDY